MASERLEKQIQFIVEIDKLKQIYRQTYLMNGSRRENSVEHSWHLALMTVFACRVQSLGISGSIPGSEDGLDPRPGRDRRR